MLFSMFSWFRRQDHQSILMTRIIAAALFTAVLAGTWDAWWHAALGRESFWSPPHLLLYSSALIAIVLGIQMWRKTQEMEWRNLALVLTLVPLSAPFDELWHRIFGEEAVNSLLIMWSPPHLFLITGIFLSLYFILRLLKSDSDPFAKLFFGMLCFAAMSNLLLFVVAPFEPTSAHALLGFWGAGILAFVFVLLLLSAQRWLDLTGAVFFTSLAIIALQAISMSEKLAPNLNITPHDHPQSWIVVFSYLIPATVVDLFKHLPEWLKGMFWGLLWSALLFGLARIWFEPQFQYSSIEALQAVVASGIGGAVAGFILSPRSS